MSLFFNKNTFKSAIINTEIEKQITEKKYLNDMQRRILPMLNWLMRLFQFLVYSNDYKT